MNQNGSAFHLYYTDLDDKERSLFLLLLGKNRAIHLTTKRCAFGWESSRPLREIKDEGLERTRDYLEAVAKRLNRKHPRRHFEVESTATYGLRIIFEFEQVPIANPVRDILGLGPVSPIFYGLDNESAKILLDANGLYEPGYNEAPAHD